MDSILTSIKKLLGIAEDYDHFDDDIVIYINTVFLDLAQIGVGPANGFSIEDESATWSDFLPDTHSLFEAAKSYVYLKVRLLFDPPLSSTVMDAINRNISELTFRLNVAAESMTESE